MPLPDTVMVRHYGAEFSGGAAVLTSADGTHVPLGGVSLYAYPDGRPLMTLNGTELRIIVPPGDGGGYIVANPSCAGGDFWWEETPTAGGREAFELCGTWVGTVAESGDIEGTISGSFGYYQGNRPNGAGPHWDINLFCRADDHRFRLVRQPAP